eukprot:scaffold132_cov61-Phaeocystis_antarctica.AAC.1
MVKAGIGARGVLICAVFDVATYGETRCAFGKVADRSTHAAWIPLPVIRDNQRASSAIACSDAAFARSVARLACSDENHCQ